MSASALRDLALLGEGGSATVGVAGRCAATAATRGVALRLAGRALQAEPKTGGFARGSEGSGGRSGAIAVSSSST